MTQLVGYSSDLTPIFDGNETILLTPEQLKEITMTTNDKTPDESSLEQDNLREMDCEDVLRSHGIGDEEIEMIWELSGSHDEDPIPWLEWKYDCVCGRDCVDFLVGIHHAMFNHQYPENPGSHCEDDIRERIWELAIKQCDIWIYG